MNWLYSLSFAQKDISSSQNDISSSQNVILTSQNTIPTSQNAIFSSQNDMSAMAPPINSSSGNIYTFLSGYSLYLDTSLVPVHAATGTSGYNLYRYKDVSGY
jgi:hypothetical protein